LKVDYQNLSRLYIKHKNDIDSAIFECLENDFLIQGPKVREFEKNLENYCAAFSAGVSSGSSALYLAFKAIGIKPGDKVIIPSFTFMATGEMLMQTGAIPIWVDSNLDDYTIDINDLINKISNDIKAIVAIDLFGHVCNYDEIFKIALAFKIPVIQDAAQSFGSKFKNKITGSYSDITCFSFRPAKNLYCMGDGGGVVSKNKKYIDYIKMACDHGRTEKYVHEFIGWNMRLDAIQANIMNKLIIHIDKFNNMRRLIAKTYDENLKIDTYVKTKEYCENSYYQYTIRVKNRDKFISKLKEVGINTGVQWPLSLHQQPAVKSLVQLPNAEKIQKEILSIPCYPYLSETELNYVIENINQII